MNGYGLMVCFYKNGHDYRTKYNRHEIFIQVSPHGPLTDRVIWGKPDNLISRKLKKNSFGTQILGLRTLSPESDMQSTWNLHSSMPS